MAAGGYMLPPPTALEIHDAQAGERWRRFKAAWSNYSITTTLNTKDEPATLLTVIGKEVYSTFTWDTDGDSTLVKREIPGILRAKKEHTIRAV